MTRRLLLINTLLAGMLILGAVELYRQVLEAGERYERLEAFTDPKQPPEFPAPADPDPTRPADFMPVVDRLLFSPDRNAEVIVETVEPQVDPRARNPARPAFDLFLGEEARDGQQDAGEDDQADRPDFPLGEVEHPFEPLVVGRLGGFWIDDLRQRGLHRHDADALGQLDLDFGVGDLGDLADQAAAGDDAVILLDRHDLGLMFLHPALLGPDHQEVEDDENQDQRNGLDEEAGAARRRGCGS